MHIFFSPLINIQIGEGKGLLISENQKKEMDLHIKWNDDFLNKKIKQKVEREKKAEKRRLKMNKV